MRWRIVARYCFFRPVAWLSKVVGACSALLRRLCHVLEYCVMIAGCCVRVWQRHDGAAARHGWPFDQPSALHLHLVSSAGAPGHAVPANFPSCGGTQNGFSFCKSTGLGLLWWCYFVVFMLCSDVCGVCVCVCVCACVCVCVRMMSREYMATAFLVLTVFATVVDKQSRHADSGVKVSLPPSACRVEEAAQWPCA